MMFDGSSTPQNTLHSNGECGLSMKTLSAFVASQGLLTHSTSQWNRHSHSSTSWRHETKQLVAKSRRSRGVFAIASEEKTKACPPIEIQNANTVIVGGGPCGLITAISLAQCGIPSTILEQDDDTSRFDPCRAYPIGIKARGRRIIDGIPGLLDHIAQGAVPFRSERFIMMFPDGTSRKSALRKSPDGGISLYMTRISLVERLKSFAVQSELVQLHQKTKVTNVLYDGCGQILIQASSNGSVREFRTRLVLACDGKNSVLHSALSKIHSNDQTLVHSSNGLGTLTAPTSSTGLLVKSIALNCDFEETPANSSNHVKEVVSVKSIRGKKGLHPLKSMWLGMFPMSDDMRRRCEGCIASTVQPADHMVWNLSNVDEGFELFEENFPHLNMRSSISHENMRRFVESKPLKFPQTSRSRSLAVYVGPERLAGVLFLGDAAHSFPPDAGQGVNAAFEDVLVLRRIIEESRQDSTIESVLKKYETEREMDIDGLMLLVRRLTGFSNSTWPMTFRLIDSTIRTKLHSLFPGVFHPSCGYMLENGYAYKDVIRFNDQTTRRILFVVLAAFSISLPPIFLSF